MTTEQKQELNYALFKATGGKLMGVNRRNYAPNVCDNIQAAFEALKEWRDVDREHRRILVEIACDSLNWECMLCWDNDLSDENPPDSYAHVLDESPSLAIALALAEAYGVTVEQEDVKA
jgi:hypothetical protein